MVKNFDVFFSSVIGLLGFFFSVLIMYPLRAPPRVSESLVKWNQFEELDAGVAVRACELSKLCCGLELIIIRCQRSN